MKATHTIRLPSYLEPRKLPVFRTVLAAYWLVARNLGPLCRVVAVPLALMLPLIAFATWLVLPWLPDPGVKKLTLANELANWALMLVQTPFLAAMAVAWHRFVLLQEAPETRLRLNAPVWKYAGVYLSFQLAVWLPMLLAKLDAMPRLSLTGLLGIVMFFFVLPRISLSLPATALEGQRSRRVVGDAIKYTAVGARKSVLQHAAAVARWIRLVTSQAHLTGHGDRSSSRRRRIECVDRDHRRDIPVVDVSLFHSPRRFEHFPALKFKSGPPRTNRGRSL